MDSFSFLFVLDFKVWKEFLISNMDSLSFEDPKSVIIVSMYSATLYSGNKCGQAQQRVFAVQVFELHRLIKVQKLIAASLELLLQSELHLGKSSIKGLPTKKLPLGNPLEAPPQLLSKLKPQKPIHNKECAVLLVCVRRWEQKGINLATK
ncbi:hypothetical protein RHMOL_Rhmol04G0154700 [Rhododendron molle]|uniref:Uncharacterized protein n=1 Tax=Rhododendron molle TaxID=49168 RepID=A0ACC0P201_RHOML|nr:hypothetical protein RHMOL_Rhmol04G0154700 [Rhododendron molle]